MSPRTFKIIVISVALILIIPASVLAFNYYKEEKKLDSKNPFDYIPSNSTAVATVNQNNSTFYIYDVHGSLGIIANISYNILPSNSTRIFSPSGTSTYASMLKNITVETMVMQQTTVYEVKNLDIGQIISGIAKTNLTALISNESTNVYVYTILNTYVVMGEKEAINDSLYSHIHNYTAKPIEKYLNMNINSSIYYNLSSSGIGASYMTLNITENKTLINMHFNSSTDALIFDLALNAALRAKSNVTSVLGRPTVISSGNNLIIKYNKGFSDIGILIKALNIKS